MRPLRSVTTSFRSRRLVHSAFHLRFREPFFSKLSSPRLDRCAQFSRKQQCASTGLKPPQRPPKKAIKQRAKGRRCGSQVTVLGGNSRYTMTR